MPDSIVNGVRLYHEEHGSGDPILCIHGTSSSALVWRSATTEALARLGRTILYDRRGCTRSERPEPYETSVSQHADDAAALLVALDASPAVVIGRSYGGGVAVGLALRRPELVRALVLLEAADMTIDGEDAPWEAAMRDAVERAAATDPSTAAEAMFRSVLGDEAWESLPADLQQLFAANSPAVIAEVRGARLDVTTADLARIAVPTLLVAAEDSPPAFRRINDLLASAIPDARVSLVGGGHLIDPADPSVLRFLGEVLGPPVKGRDTRSGAPTSASDVPTDHGQGLSSDAASLTLSGPKGSTPRSDLGPDDPFPRELAIDLVKRVPAYARLAWALSREPDLPRVRRLALAGAVAYLVSPIDAIPGFIPVIGQVDDIVVVLLTLRFALAALSPEQRRRHLAAAGLTEEDTATDLDAVAAMGAWLLRTGGRAGMRASAVAIDVGRRWAPRIARRAGDVAGRVGAAGTRRVTDAVASRLPSRARDDAPGEVG